MNITTYKNIHFTPYYHPELGEMLSSKDVALGYGVHQKTLNDHRATHSDELIEGIHWLRVEVQTKGGKQKVIHWTLDGIHMLGFFIKSAEAKHFRKWASKLITEMKKQYKHPPTPDPPQTPAQTIRYNVGPLPADIATIVDILKSLNQKEKKDVMRYALTINLKTMPNLLREMADNYDKIN